MKNFLCLAILIGLSVPMTVACSHTVSSDDKTVHHLNGTTTHDETTVKQNDLTGSTSVEKEKSSN